MIHYEDILAARVLDRQLPQQQEAIKGVLRTLSADGSQAGLLATLVQRRLLTSDQARFVHDVVEREKRAGQRNVYAKLLIHGGVPAERVQQLLTHVGDGGLDACGRAAVGAGWVSADQDQQLRYQTRVVSDREGSRQVQVYRQSLEKRDARVSGALRAVQAGSARDSDLAVEALREQDLAPPRFAIPDWVDTSDPRANKALGSYRVLGRIGAGAMGIVYLADARDEPDRPVAVKVLGEGDGSEESVEARGRFKREILANSFFSHPGVIDVYDAGQTPAGEDFLAMEFFDGEDLEQVLETEERLDPKRALDLCRQVFTTLGAAHDAGIVHRDVKPANILVSRDGNQAKLMDFGIAIIRDLGEFEHMVFKTIEGGATGTPQYMSPEQAAGDQLTFSSDLYSMGLVLYECLSGRLPFESETANGFMACHMLEDPLPLAKASSTARGLPKELHTLLDGLLDKNPANRPPSAAAVVEVLDQVAGSVSESRSSTGRLLGRLWRGRRG